MSALVGLGAVAAVPAPDIIVTYQREPPRAGPRGEYIMRRHGSAVRMDSVWTHDDGAPRFNQAFTRPAQQVSFSISRTPDGRLFSLGLMDDPLTAPPPLASRRFTGALERHLGLRCRVWRLTTPTRSGSYERSGCMTPDRIDLWMKNGGYDHVVATRIERRSVPAAQVRPPIEALDLRRWGVRDTGDHRRDYAVLLRGRDGARIFERRSADWTLTLESRPWGGDRAMLSHETNATRLDFTRSREGQRSLQIHRQSQIRRPTPRPDAPGARLLGNECRWDRMSVPDASFGTCLTADGIPLASEEWSWGFGTAFVAVRLSRAPQPFGAILPGPNIVDPRVWGL